MRWLSCRGLIYSGLNKILCYLLSNEKTFVSRVENCIRNKNDKIIKARVEGEIWFEKKYPKNSGIEAVPQSGRKKFTSTSIPTSFSFI